MGVAMLTGEKRMETRKRRLAKGWYNLHIGRGSKTSTAGCVIGMIHVDRILDCNLLQDSWAKPEFGQFSSVIDKTVQFGQPVGPISGGQAIWYIKDKDMMRQLAEQVSEVECRSFEPYRPDLPDLSSFRRQTVYTPWTKAPRKRKQREEKTAEGGNRPARERQESRRMQRREKVRKRKWHPTSMASNQPASSNVQDGPQVGSSADKARSKTTGQDERGTGRSVATNCPKELSICFFRLIPSFTRSSTGHAKIGGWTHMAHADETHRLEFAGRLAKVERSHLGTASWSVRQGQDRPDLVLCGRFFLPPTCCHGGCCTLESLLHHSHLVGCSVISCLSFKALLHHAPRRQQKKEGFFVGQSRHVYSVRHQDLEDIGVHFQVLPRKGGLTATLRFRRLCSTQVSAMNQTTQAQHLHALANLWSGVACTPHLTEPCANLWSADSLIRVLPAAAEEHQRQSNHTVLPRPEHRRIRFVLDLPVPLQLDTTPMRCRSIGCASETRYFTVTWDDLQARFPGLLRWHGDKFGEVLFTKKLLLYLVQSFYERLNMRSVRRGLVEHYANNILALNVASPASELLRSIPQSGTLAALLVSGMERFLQDPWTALLTFYVSQDNQLNVHGIAPLAVLIILFCPVSKEKVKNVQEGLHIYCGSILRGDGHHRIARRVVKHVDGKRTRPWNVLLGWVGVDGALLAPPSLSASEMLGL